MMPEKKGEIMHSILLVDDDDDFRRAARLVFQLEGFKVLEAKNGFEAIDSFTEFIPDLVIVDMKIPGINGIDTVKALKHINSSVPIIMLTAYGTIPDAVKAVHGGALDFIQKTAPYDELVELIKKAIENSCKGVLSPREVEILRWVKEGKNNQEIGELLNISESTVKAHLKHSYKKLHVTNRAQAMNTAISLGIIQPDKH